ncbi:MAG: site-2 protease family protein [Brevinematales bacterium]|nr:site-2 protease family protein [Brevinematales bacterium]
MIFIKIILGLFGLGIVVFVHELGHFLTARLAKIDVDAFSIGWGNPILKKKIGTVEYRLGMFPIGGYCKMKGEADYGELWENMHNGEKPENGSYLAAGPAARIFVHFGGPFFNLIFAVILLSFLWGFGFEINTLSNKIILASEIIPGETYPADSAGLKTGDRIIEIAGKPISYHHEVQENIALNPDKALPVLVERNGELIKLNVTPSLDKSTGAGKIGVYFWVDPVIKNIKDGSPAQLAGLMPGDRITGANGQKLRNSMDLMKIVEQNPDRLVLDYDRAGAVGEVQFNNDEIKNEIGITWDSISYRTPNLSLPSAIAKGVKESWKTLTISITSLRLLFKGIDLTKAVSGPVRITYMIGEMATQGFEQGFGTSVRSITNFLAFISIVICVMNLLPVPILDGGMIILFIVELIRRKPAHPKAISVFQTCGMVFIFGLMALALFGDILFFIR